MSTLPVTYEDIEAAAARISGVAHRTPVLTSATANRQVDAGLFFKCENFQRAGAFKFRGAFNVLAALSSEKRRGGVLTYSSGNHAQAAALAGRIQEIPVTIVMPTDAPEAKLQAVRGYGGEIIFYDRYSEHYDDITRRVSAERGLHVVSPFDDPYVIAGQGTATTELIEETGPLDRLFVSLGGGGLLAGAAVAAAQLSPGCKVIGVEPEAGDDGRKSFQSGSIVKIPTPKSIADGALTTAVGEHNFSIMRALVDDVVTASDEQLRAAMRFFAERMKMVVEPTGCLAAAAVFTRAFHKPGERVGILISGGNVDLKRFAEIVGQV